MRHIVEAGTDVAHVILFDPHALPEGFDERLDEAFEILGELHKQERLFLLETGGDGDYLLHAFVDEDPAEELRRYLQDPITLEQFAANSGKICFSGMEYVYRENDSRYKRAGSMGGSFLVEPGTYRVILYRTEYPDSLHEDRFRERATTAQRLAFRMVNFVGTIAVLSIVASVIALFTMTWNTWIHYFPPVIAIAVALLMLFNRLPTYRSAKVVWKTINDELPSMVATLVRKS